MWSFSLLLVNVARLIDIATAKLTMEKQHILSTEKAGSTSIRARMYISFVIQQPTPVTTKDAQTAITWKGKMESGYVWWMGVGHP